MINQPLKRRNFTLTTQHGIAELIQQLSDCPEFAYIIHDRDTHADGTLKEPHLHAYIEFPNPRSFQSIADLLSVEINVIQKIKNKHAILQYFIHKNDPDKFQYDITDITTNFDIEHYIMTNTDTLWTDFFDLKYQRLSPNQFYEKHKSSINSNSFFQRLRIFDMITSYDKPADFNNTPPPIHTLLKTDNPDIT